MDPETHNVYDFTVVFAPWNRDILASCAKVNYEMLKDILVGPKNKASEAAKKKNMEMLRRDIYGETGKTLKPEPDFFDPRVQSARGMGP